MQDGHTRHRRGSRYKKPLLHDPWAIRLRELAAMLLLGGLMIFGLAAAAML